MDIGLADRPLGPTAGGSQVTPSTYPTTVTATQKVMAHLRTEAEVKLGLNNAQIGQGGLNHQDGFTPWQEVLAVAEPFSANDKRGAERGPLGLKLNMSMGENAPAVGLRFGHGAVVTELELDTRLGKIKPLNVWTAVAVGKIHVPHLANSQMYSGVNSRLGLCPL